MSDGEQINTRRVSLKTLAEHLKLSPTTISVVLNNASGIETIALQTQARVLAAAKRFKYKPNRLARSLRTQRTFTIGVVVPEFSEGYFTMVMEGLEACLLNAGYMHTVLSHQGKSQMMREHPRQLLDRSVDGMILVNTKLQEPTGTPVVCISGHEEIAGVTNLMINHDSAAIFALQHLYDLGHRKIAFMKGPSSIADSKFRWTSIQAAAGLVGIVMRDDLCVHLADHASSPELGYNPVRQLLARTRDFSAIFCFNDLAAIGALRAFADVGLQCPRDISVIGFDDIASATFQIPRLTTVAQPLRLMGETGAQTLLKRLQKPNDAFPDAIVFEPQFIRRESTGPVPRLRRSNRVSH